MGYVYGIFNEDKCVYIGQTKRKPKERMREHYRDIEKKKHKIKQLNNYNVEELDFRVLLELNTDNSLLLSFSECLMNSIYHPYNRCVIQGFRGNTVTLARCNEDTARELIEDIEKLVS